MIEFLARLIGNVALVGILEGMGTDELLLYAIEKFDAALFAFVVIHHCLNLIRVHIYWSGRCKYTKKLLPLQPICDRHVGNKININ